MYAEPTSWPDVVRQGNLDSMTTRSAALITIALLAVLLAFVALAALFAGDISERAGGIVTSVLGTFATVLAGLLLFLRVETVNTKVDDAAEKATVAAEKAAVVEQKIDRVHDDVLNGPMRENVKRAIKEAETDPAIQEQRIENVAKGVQADRHELGSREQAAYARGVADAMKRQQHLEERAQRGSSPESEDT
jgi:hypothetical protein